MPTDDEILRSAVGDVVLRRDPRSRRADLRAWDAADEYALAQLATGRVRGRVLVVNDGFGALAVSLAPHAEVTSWSDSVVATLAARDNLVVNGLDASAVHFLPSTDDPTGRFDAVVVKVPRALAMLQDQLRRIHRLVDGDSVVIGAGMTKTVHRSTIDAFEESIGPTPTSLARKKARLLLATVDPALDAPAPLAPTTWTTPEGITVTNWPNVFSAGRLDAGTELLLAHLPPAEGRIVDLACGNGVVGATLAHRYPDLEVVATDDSHHAVASARVTLAGVTDRATVFATDVLDGVTGPVDLVAVNPPFHVGGARSTTVADAMFDAARRILRPGAPLVVVGNRNLRYHRSLATRFSSVDAVSADPTYVVLVAR